MPLGSCGTGFLACGPAFEQVQSGGMVRAPHINGNRAVRIIAWMDTALDTGQFVPYATGMAEALDAELTLIRGECAEAELCDAGGADLLLVMDTRLRALPVPWAIRPSRRLLRVKRTPVCIVPASVVERGRKFQPDPILCEVGLDGTDGSLLAEASSLACLTGTRMHLLYTLPESGEQLLSRGVEGPEGSPLSHGEALRRMHELSSLVLAPHAISIVPTNSRRRIKDIESGLLITRPSTAGARLREGFPAPVLSVRPDSKWTLRPNIHRTFRGPISYAIP